jgi:hypothetical protein
MTRSQRVFGLLFGRTAPNGVFFPGFLFRVVGDGGGNVFRNTDSLDFLV